MAKKRQDGGARFVLDLIDTIDDNEKSALEAVRKFVDSVDDALPNAGKQTPRRRVEIIDAALKMIERLLGVSNDTARRVTESVRKALPAIEQEAQELIDRAGAKKPAAKKAAAKKKTAAKKKAPAKKAAAKKASRGKAAAKRAA